VTRAADVRQITARHFANVNDYTIEFLDAM
jgi:hypothetical protein